MERIKVGFVLPKTWEGSSTRVRGWFIYNEMKRMNEIADIYSEFSNIDDYNILFFQKIHDKKAIELVEEAKKRHIKTVFDFVDKDDSIKDMICSVDMIITDTEIHKEYCKELGKLGNEINIEIVEDSIDYLFEPLSDRRKHVLDNNLSVVFFASPSNLDCIEICRAALIKARGEKQFNFYYISGRPRYDLFDGLDAKFIRWNPYTFTYHLTKADIAVLPQKLESKGNSKLIQSITHRVPAISSNIISYRKVAEATDTKEFLCDTSDDWFKNLIKMFSPEVRNLFVAKTEMWAWANYNVHVITEQYVKLFYKLLGGKEKR